MDIPTYIKVELDADQVYAYICNEMDAKQQAELLMWMGRRYVVATSVVIEQMRCVKEEFDDFDKRTQNRVIKFLERLLGHLKGEEE